MLNKCVRCRRPRPSFDDHTVCPQCWVAAGLCQVDAPHPCSVCAAWPVRTWNKLRKSLGDVRLRSIQRGRQHWTSAFPQIEAWIINRSASTAASFERGSEISSLVDSGDDFSNNNLIISTTELLVGDFEVHKSVGVTLPPSSTAMSGKTLTPGTKQTSDVPMNDLPQTKPSVSGFTEGLAAMPLITKSSHATRGL